eukprot:CAMPEP_0168477478 /NCGR_PEP_ID=MMETSP0228-20121227/62435_1 /TAXON_ID=133427 /ORGANISM="Protoceratium reticulatum, Strain CCCM 535 (=CCMP 1889)" /LENGTH=70 /DNA_ID=CAMNT_0008493653 /DNA_START=103 /DNA_END=315 /DNA_ORIENTATION=-
MSSLNSLDISSARGCAADFFRFLALNVQTPLSVSSGIRYLDTNASGSPLSSPPSVLAPTTGLVHLAPAGQ